ncbi:mitochondrial hypoxia responsive domain protein [Penicillium brasilianum]|uniref:Mitochondrial hypoxia responsive domain protein n=1 Tax=Penicillium brasilianum TaxID=104259 RepID=A0A1S9RAD6_PENBI|nr:mitochondrial hypoxia responsive domain protein [Penicillium brasilianum]
MKLLTKEEEDAHYRSVVKGGSFGGILGLAGGVAGVMLASRRYHTIRNLTLPMKAFLVTSSGTFVGIIAADHASRDFEKQQNAARMWYENREERLHAEQLRGLSFTDRALAFARREKYKIVGATWIASMIGSFVLVSRNPYLSGQQKIVQARVYAQGLTLAVLCASAAFEISDQRRGRGLLDAAKKNKKQQLEDAAEPAPVHAGDKDQSDLWKEMVAAEEQRLKSKHQPLHVKHEELHEAAKAKEGASESASEDSKSEDNSESESESKEEPKAAKAEGKKQA